VGVLLQPMEAAAIFLLVPLAIIIGHRRPTGAVIVSGFLASVAAIVFWIFLGGMRALNEDLGPDSRRMIMLFLLYGEVLLLITAWTLALHSAVWARRWGWGLLLVVAGYISFTALIIGISSTNPCAIYFGSESVCAEASPLVSLALYASHLVGPVVATLYGVLALSALRRQPLAPDVVATTFTTSAEEDTEPGLA
jgi:hypothetical protein